MRVYEQMLQLYPDERKKNFVDLKIELKCSKILELKLKTDL